MSTAACSSKQVHPGISLDQLPSELLIGIFKYLEYEDFRTVWSLCTINHRFEELSYELIFWKHVLKAAPDTQDTLLAIIEKRKAAKQNTILSKLRASIYKINYAKIISTRSVGSPLAETKMQLLRKKLISLASKSTSDIEKLALTSTCIEFLAKQLQNITYIPVKVAFLGDRSIRKTSSIYKLIYTNSEAFDESQMNISYCDPLGTNLFNFIEDSLERPLRVTIFDPPGDNMTAVKRSLHGVDAVLIGFSFDNIASAESVKIKWIPLVRKFQPAVPIVVIGLTLELTANPNFNTIKEELHRKLDNIRYIIHLGSFSKLYYLIWGSSQCKLVL